MLKIPNDAYTISSSRVVLRVCAHDIRMSMLKLDKGLEELGREFPLSCGCIALGMSFRPVSCLLWGRIELMLEQEALEGSKPR
jgi:hypothetical protein